MAVRADPAAGTGAPLSTTNTPSSIDATGAPGPAERLAGMLSPQAIDALLADADASGTAIDGPDGLLAKMTKAVLERALDAEMADHLGYEAGDRAGIGSGNSRNGDGRKTVHTTAGPVELEVPRDRNGSFTPVIVPKRRRRLGNVEDMILSLYARGMSTRDITAHLEEVYGASVSAARISRVTDVVAEEVTAWQNRPVDPVYPILYIDAIADQGPRRRGGRQQGRPPGRRGRSGRPQAGPAGLDPADRGREVLVRGAHRAAQPRPQGRPDRLLRRADRPAGGGQRRLAGRGGADLRGAPDPRLHALRVLEGPQGDDRRAAADLHRFHRGRRRAGLRCLPGRVGHPGGRRGAGVGAGLGGV